ncbi:MAG: DUF2288 family protein [Oligoflexia bacterium]|jgi:hypothetical protein
MPSDQDSAFKALFEALEDTHGPAEWTLLKPHAKRDAVLLVEASLDLMAVARAVAADDTESVQLWLNQKKLMRPNSEQISEWDAHPSKTFETVVVAPYVLIKELLS